PGLSTRAGRGRGGGLGVAGGGPARGAGAAPEPDRPPVALCRLAAGAGPRRVPGPLGPPGTTGRVCHPLPPAVAPAGGHRAAPQLPLGRLDCRLLLLLQGRTRLLAVFGARRRPEPRQPRPAVQRPAAVLLAAAPPDRLLPPQARP